MFVHSEKHHLQPGTKHRIFWGIFSFGATRHRSPNLPILKKHHLQPGTKHRIVGAFFGVTRPPFNRLLVAKTCNLQPANNGRHHFFWDSTSLGALITFVGTPRRCIGADLDPRRGLPPGSWWRWTCRRASRQRIQIPKFPPRRRSGQASLFFTPSQAVGAPWHFFPWRLSLCVSGGAESVHFVLGWSLAKRVTPSIC